MSESKAKYDLAMIDPPWDLRMAGKKAVSPTTKEKLAYETMGFQDVLGFIESIVRPILKADHNLFLWTVDQYLALTLSNFDWLGYRRHAIMIWDKCNGLAPAFTVRYAHEYLIWYYKGKFQPVDTSARGIFTTVFTEGSREHSRKPDKAYEIINRLYPNQKKIDIFSREKRDGWDQYGNEEGYFSWKDALFDLGSK
jgi:N6-adenosine-specific RNA methylase IME4